MYEIATLDFDDFSFHVINDAIFSILEPCLGVANACLPVLPPVVGKLSEGRVFTYVSQPFISKNRSTLHKGGSYNNNSMGGTRSSAPPSNSFQRINDKDDQDIPLYHVKVTADYDTESQKREHPNW